MILNGLLVTEEEDSQWRWIIKEYLNFCVIYAVFLCGCVPMYLSEQLGGWHLLASFN